MTPLNTIETFKSKISIQPSGCWEWKGNVRPDGYGRMRFNGRDVMAHRLSYIHHVGPIPEGLTLDHLCRNHKCVNPEHLEPVSIGDNVLRGIGIAALNARTTHCPQGHPYDSSNTYPNYSPGERGRRSHRRCRQCSIGRCRRYWATNKDDQNAKRRKKRLPV